MLTPDRYVRRGERWRPSARWQNEVSDAVRGLRRPGLAAPPAAAAARPGNDWLAFRNDAAVPLLRGQAAGISGTVFEHDDFAAAVLLTARVPNGEDLGRWGIVQTPAGPGRSGTLLVDGVTLARVLMHDDGHRLAEVAPDYEDESLRRVLHSGAAGSAQLLYVQPRDLAIHPAEGPYQAWCAVRLAASGAAADWYTIEAWNSGAFAVANSGADCIPVSNPEADPVPVYFVSYDYDAAAGEIGRVDLAMASHLKLGDKILAAAAAYVDGQTRLTAVHHVIAMC